MDREKVIKGLECHRVDDMNRINCSDCPYYESDDARRCFNYLHDDAIVLLKEQEQMIDELKGFINGLSKDVIVPVRCKDCKQGEQSVFPNRHLWCGIHEFYREPNWFCADGERRTDDD